MKLKLLMAIALALLVIPTVFGQAYPEWQEQLDYTGSKAVPKASDTYTLKSDLNSVCNSGDPFQTFSLDENINDYDVIMAGNTLQVQNLDPSYTGADSFSLTCSAYGVTITQNVNIEVRDPLETELDGIDIVLVGEDQYFNARVTNGAGQAVEGATVNVFNTVNDTDINAGQCVTEQNGECEVMLTMNDLGNYTTYATSTKDGFYLADDDEDSTFLFQVIGGIYQIEELQTYTGADFMESSDSFFRGEPLYLSFKVYDTLAQAYVTRDDNIVEYVTLETEFMYLDEAVPANAETDRFYYKINSIPLQDSVLGQLLLFGFEFDNQIHSFSTEEVIVNVNNNNPEITGEIGPRTVDGKGLIIDLSKYESDTEDSGNDLAWTFQDGSTEITDNQDPLFGSAIVGKTLQLVGSIIENVMDFFMQLHDSDGGMAEQNVLVDVTGVGVPDFRVEIQADTSEGEAPLEVQFTAAPQFGDQPISYSWDFNGDGIEDSTVQNPSAVFNEEGSYTVRLTATDNNNMTATSQIGIMVTSPPVHTGRDEPRELAPKDKLYVGRVGMPQQGVITSDTKSMSFTVNFRNTGDEKLKDLSIRASIPDLAMRARSAGPFDLRVGEELHERVRFETDGDMQPGYYLVHLTISSDDIYREANREVWVE